MKWKGMMVAAIICSLYVSTKAHSQNVEDYIDDPEVRQMIKAQQEANKKIPAELFTLIPAGLTAYSTNFSREVQMNTTLSFNLVCSPKGQTDPLTILLMAFNLKDENGAAYAKMALPEHRKTRREDWLKEHKPRKEGFFTYHEPVVTAVPNGTMTIQKVFMEKHGDGEGDVPAKTFYEGLLALDWNWGFVTAESGTGSSPAQMEKWFKSVAAAADKLDGNKYFK